MTEKEIREANEKTLKKMMNRRSLPIADFLKEAAEDREWQEEMRMEAMMLHGAEAGDY